VIPAPRSDAVVRSYTPRSPVPGSRLPAWQHPRLLAALGVTLAVATVVAAVVGTRRGGVANALAMVLVLASAAASYRAVRLAGRYELGVVQRGALLRCLARLEPLEVRVSAVNQPDAIHYARRLRDVLQEAHWPASGIFRCDGGVDGAGVTLAVRNVVVPPAEALALMDTLRRAGAPAVWGHKPDLADDRCIEVRVGRLR
jgi:hypothetical protein